jgi:cobyrinic acid a,c-diamide synthase
MTTVQKIVVAGVTSGVGKTTVASAIMYALHRKKGLVVQPFKIGPDFIDPSYHTFVTGRKSRNLDAWLMGRRGIIDSFNSACEGADIAVIEGVMGLFDGMSGKDDFASTAHVAKILDSPVVLVVDAGKGARSVAAIVLGFMHFDRDTKIEGLILNNVASDRHECYLREALKGKIKAPLLGVVRRNKEMRMEERHLGLVPTYELQKKKRLEILEAGKYVSEQIDIDAILKVCRKGKLGPRESLTSPLFSSVDMTKRTPEKKVTIAVALDESFNFYYADNLAILKRSGARLVFFSPVNDDKLPDGIDGIMLGGGFPEVLADELEKNRAMRRSIAKCVNAGMPIYCECGGLMYLTRSIRGYKGKKKAHRMAGIIDADTIMTPRLTLSYTEAECNGPIFGTRRNVHGHEFHYSLIENIASDSRFSYSMKKGKGITEGKDGIIIGDTGLAAYMHLHFAGNNELAKRLVSSCASYSRR